MHVESARELLLSLPHVVETQQWGDNLVFWVGDKAIGGKMFCMLNLGGDSQGVVSFASTPDSFAELVEQDGLLPAPYFARIYWVAAERWTALRDDEWREVLQIAHARVLSKHTPKLHRILAMTKTEQKKLVAAARKVRAAK